MRRQIEKKERSQRQQLVLNKSEHYRLRILPVLWQENLVVFTAHASECSAAKLMSG